MRRLTFGVIELAVLHASARAHALHIARWYALDVAHAVFVRQFARHDIADDLHVFVAVCAKACTGRNAVFIDDAQVAKTHVLFIEITCK